MGPGGLASVGGGACPWAPTLWGSARTWPGARQGLRVGHLVLRPAWLRGVTHGISTRQPLVFGAMVHRDEAFETIFSQYMKITAAAASGSDS